MNLKLFPLDTQVLFKCLNSIFSDEIHSQNSKLSAFALFYIFQFQTCHLTIASYGWTANDLIYLWKVKKGYLWNVIATKIWNLTNSFIGVSYMSLLDESVVLEQN